MKYFLNIEEIRPLAKGHWDYIFSALAPQLSAAMEQPGKHVPCPVHGGKDGFRLFPNYQENGACVCNTCGEFRDGFKTLEWINGWSFFEVLKHVGALLGFENSTSKLIRTELMKKKFVGTILRMSSHNDSGKETFIVELCEEDHNQQVQKLRGKGLQKACAIAGVKEGDRVCLTLFSKQTYQSSSGTFHTYHWGAERLPSMEEEERATQKQRSEDTRRENAIVSTWENAKRFSWKDPECEPLAKYFLSRCLKVTDPELVEDLRFSPKISYLNPDGSKNEFCAMIAAIRNSEGKLIAVHKTFLTKDGKKASVGTPQKISCLPSNVSLTGCAIRIGKPTKYLAVAEGIETALSVSIATGLPCWSCVNAYLLEAVEIPASVEVVFIFADKDRSLVGTRSARALRDRLVQRGVMACIDSIEEEIPEGSKGIDWNDILRNYGMEAFPLTKL